MDTNSISEPDIPKFGRLIQEVRERNRKSQEVVFQHWREILEDSGHTRKWPEAGGRLIGRIERGEIVKLLSNIEISVLCDVLGCSSEERSLLFTLLRRIAPDVPPEKPIDYYSCFISYSHADKSFARRLYNALQDRGIRCWLDEHQLLPGQSIYDELDRGIRLWDKILLCASESSLKSWWVDNEIDKAFEKEQALMKQYAMKIPTLIPLNLDNALWRWQNGKANQVRSRLAADFTDWEIDSGKFEREFERLVKALRTDDGREDPPESKLRG